MFQIENAVALESAVNIRCHLVYVYYKDQNDFVYTWALQVRNNRLNKMNSGSRRHYSHLILLFLTQFQSLELSPRSQANRSSPTLYRIPERKHRLLLFQRKQFL